MSPRTGGQVEAKQADGSSFSCDASKGEEAQRKFAPPQWSLEIETLRRRHAAPPSPTHTRPPFEELKLDSLGGLPVKLTDVNAPKAQGKSFKLIFESNPVPMWLFDTDNMRILAVNDAAIAHYGYDKVSFLALTLLDILPQEDRDAVEHAIRTTPELSEGGPDHVWRHVKADGTRIDVLTYWRTTVFRDRPAQLVAIMDVTEKRQAEKRINYWEYHDTLCRFSSKTAI